MANNILIRNMIRCKHCSDVIESKHRHDFRSCKCRAVAIDGGLAYQKRSYPSGGRFTDHYEELSVWGKNSREVVCADGPRAGAVYYFDTHHKSFNLHHLDFEGFKQTGIAAYVTSVYDICFAWGSGVRIGVYRGRL